MALRFKVAAAALVASLACLNSWAQPTPAWPTKPVKIIVPFPAGGTTDAIPRILAEKLSARWGQQVLVENRPGAGGNLGAEAAYRADADGHTLLVSAPGPLVVAPSLYKKLNFDATRFESVSLLATMPNLLAVRTGLPVSTLQELVALARKEPGKISYASQGNGTTSHLTSNMFQQMTGTELLHVPYKGSAPAMSDLVGGQVDMMFDNVTSSIAQYKGGRIKVLAVATPKRLASLPEIPTAEEAGLKGFVASTFVAMVAPPGTPAAVVAKIQKDVAEAVRLPDVQKKFADLGAEPVGGTQNELAKFLSGETARWKEVIQRANVQVD